MFLFRTSHGSFRRGCPFGAALAGPRRGGSRVLDLWLKKYMPYRRMRSAVRSVQVHTGEARRRIRQCLHAPARPAFCFGFSRPTWGIEPRRIGERLPSFRQLPAASGWRHGSPCLSSGKAPMGPQGPLVFIVQARRPYRRHRHHWVPSPCLRVLRAALPSARPHLSRPRACRVRTTA